MDQTAERYLKRLRRNLVCSREDRERLLADAGDMLENFAQENPGGFYKDYIDSFGPPEVFAAEMLSNLDPEDVAEARQRRRRALVGAGAVAAALLVLLAGFWFGRRSQGQSVTETPRPTASASPSPTAEPTAVPTPEESEPIPAQKDGAAYIDSICTDSDAIFHKRAAAVLVELGIMGVNDEGQFHPENTVSRAEAAKLIARIMCGGREIDTGVKETPSFSDIQGLWAEAYIEYCFDLGIVFSSEGEDGLFRPDDPITTLELIRMVLCTLGHDADAYRLRGNDWAVRTDELARTKDPSLYEGLEGVVMAEPVTRDAAAQILYNALRSTPKRVVPNYNTADGTVTWQYVDATTKDGAPITLFRERFDLELEELSFE